MSKFQHTVVAVAFVITLAVIVTIIISLKSRYYVSAQEEALWAIPMVICLPICFFSGCISLLNLLGWLIQKAIEREEVADKRRQEALSLQRREADKKRAVQLEADRLRVPELVKELRQTRLDDYYWEMEERINYLLEVIDDNPALMLLAAKELEAGQEYWINADPGSWIPWSNTATSGQLTLAIKKAKEESQGWPDVLTMAAEAVVIDTK